jgi:hypothetical protein
VILLSSIVSAATVAVVDFDGYGVSFSDAQTVTQGVRDAFLEAGVLDPLSGSDIADGVSKGQDDALRRARDLVAEGRRLYTSGDPSGALEPLAEALNLHAEASSSVGRRPELADATFLTGACLLKAGRSAEARDSFAEVVFLVPQYAKERGTRMSSEAAGMLATAEDTLARGPKRSRPAGDIEHIAATLQVDYVVTGWVNAEGVVSAKLYQDGQLVGEAKATLEERPPLPIDGAYNTLVAALNQPAAVVEEPEPEPEPEEDPEPPPDFEEGTAKQPTARKPPKTRIKSAGSMRYDEGPITQQWWFWAGAVAIAGGGTAGLVYGLSEPPTTYQEEPDGWSVTVITE